MSIEKTIIKVYKINMQGIVIVFIEISLSISLPILRGVCKVGISAIYLSKSDVGNLNPKGYLEESR